MINQIAAKDGLRFQGEHRAIEAAARHPNERNPPRLDKSGMAIARIIAAGRVAPASITCVG
jgi:hypothetical protein